MLSRGSETPEALRFLAEDSGNIDESGNFSLQVLRIALQEYGVMLVDSQHRSMAAEEIDPATSVAFVCNLQSHWFTIRKINDKWFNFNSLLKDGPDYVSDFYLNAYLAQLRGEGWRIFIVRGTLPEINLATSFAIPSRIHYIKDIMNKTKETASTTGISDGSSSRSGTGSRSTVIGGGSSKFGTNDEDEDLARAIAASLSRPSAASNIANMATSTNGALPSVARVAGGSTEKDEDGDDEDDDDDDDLKAAMAMSLSQDTNGESGDGTPGPLC